MCKTKKVYPIYPSGRFINGVYCTPEELEKGKWIRGKFYTKKQLATMGNYNLPSPINPIKPNSISRWPQKPIPNLPPVKLPPPLKPYKPPDLFPKRHPPGSPKWKPPFS